MSSRTDKKMLQWIEDETISPPVSLDIAGTAPQLDDTDKLAVSLYGSGSAAGDTAVDVDSNGNIIVALNSVRVSQTPTVTAGAYSANDTVGGLLTFANAARISGGGGVIKSVIFVDDAGQDVALELWLFDQTFTAISDNAAWAVAEASLHNLVAVISSTEGTWRASGTPSVCDVECSRAYVCAATSLFGQLVTRGTPTFAATDDVTVIIELLQD